MRSNPQLRDSALFCQNDPPGHFYNSPSSSLAIWPPRWSSGAISRRNRKLIIFQATGHELVVYYNVHRAKPHSNSSVHFLLPKLTLISSASSYSWSERLLLCRWASSLLEPCKIEVCDEECWASEKSTYVTNKQQMLALLYLISLSFIWTIQPLPSFSSL